MRSPRTSILFSALLLAVAGAVPVLAAAAEAFRVCADPNSMPFSNRAGEGFENRLAAMLADDLGVPVEYTWFPQRRGFIRNTLRNQNPETGDYLCDVVMGLPHGFELAVTTDPYYRSTYALVFSRSGALADIQSADDLTRLDEETRRSLRFGVFVETPGASWLAKRGFQAQMVPYPALNGDPNAYPGQVIEQDLAAGELDAAILWGPVAGYFVSRLGREDVGLLPLQSEPGARFDFAISMGVRFGDKTRKDQLEQLLARHQEDIRALLREFHVPEVDESGQPI